MKRKYKTYLCLFVIYSLLAFPSFYFVYKFGDPTTIAHDFFQYYRLYSNWDWSNVNAPFNMRLISSFLVFLFNKIGLHYETATAFDHYISYGFDKNVFFNALLFNYLTVVSTSTLIYIMVYKHFNNHALSFGAGTIYLLGFGTIFYELSPLTDAFAVLLFAVILYQYLLRSSWVYLTLLFAIFQREYILMAMPLIALLDYYKTRQNYFLKVMVLSTVSFLCFFLLRKTFFYTPALNYQTSPQFLLQAVTHINIPLVPFFKQMLLSLNVFIIYFMVIIYKRKNNLIFDKLTVFKLALLFIQVIILGFAVLGNNAGRCFYMLMPFIIFELAKEIKPIIFKQSSLNQ